jgi:hypothetical protein
MPNKPRERIKFFLERDKDGYPPDHWETLWAYKVQSGLYCIDNIPFFVRGISSQDIVATEKKAGELYFTELVLPSRNSVFRLYVFDQRTVQAVRDEFRHLGCESELSHIANLIAVEVPGNVAIKPVLDLLVEGGRAGRWEYQEGVLRHAL